MNCIQKIEKIPSLVFIALLIYFVNDGLINSREKWFYIHSNMFIVMSSILICSLVQTKKKNVLFLSTFIISLFLEQINFFHHLAHWLFIRSPIKHIFDFLAVKDANIAAMIVIITLSLILLGFTIFNIFRHKFNLAHIFILITSGAIILTTAIFHYYIINHNLAREKSRIMEDLVELSKIKQPLLGLLCKAKGYQCYEKPNAQEFEAHSSQLRDIYQTFKNNNSPVIQANYTINDDFIVIVKRGDSWLLDFRNYKEAFKNSEAIFLSLCVWAHGFWLLFMTFLITFHLRAKR